MLKLEKFDFSRKIFFHVDKLAELKAGQRPFPITVEIDLTNRCNHRCTFCFFAEHIATDTSTHQTDVIKERIVELKNLGTRGISFTGGGEPMIHKAYPEILEHTRTLGLDCGTITNGSAITPQTADIMVNNLSWVRVSMAGGTPEAYLAVQGKDHFERVIDNLRLLTKRKEELDSKINIGVRMLVTPDNLISVSNMASTLAAVGVNYLQVAPDQFTDDNGAFWDADDTRAIIAKASETLAAAGIDLLTTGYMQLQDQLDFPQTCYAHFLQIAIMADGTVTYCKNARDDKKFHIGNIYQQTLEEIWAGEVTKSIESWVRPNNCGMLCKNVQQNNAIEQAFHPQPDMSPNFVG